MRLALIGGLVLLCGCVAEPPPGRAPVKLGEEFALALGESVGIDKQGVSVAFNKVLEDSRCPMNARCIWEGNAKIALEISQYPAESGSRRNAARIPTTIAELDTSTRFKTREKMPHFVLELRRLDPDRVAGAPTGNYVATLFVGTP